MSAYAEHLKARLSTYKRDRLAVSEDGVWRGNGRAYPHILPERQFRLNILESIREEFWSYYDARREELALHTDFHHLNSSQACAFNLLYPWLARRELHVVLLRAFGLPSTTIEEWRFEHMPDQEERTTVDCYLQLGSGAKVLVELKLTEESFGLVTPKDSHREKRRNTYLPRLDGKALLENLDEPFFFLNYQLFRNVSHLDIARGDRLLLVLPRANALTWLQGEAFRERLTPGAKDAVQMVAIEDLVRRLQLSATGDDAIAAHVAEFSEKYACAEPPVSDH